MSTKLTATDQAVAEAIRKALGAADKVGDFVATQAPDIVQQLLQYHYIKSLSLTVFGLSIIVTSSIVAGVFWRKRAKVAAKALILLDSNQSWRYQSDAYDEAHSESQSWLGASCATGAIGGVIGLGIFLTNVFDFIKVAYAPKLFLMEYLARLVH